MYIGTNSGKTGLDALSMHIHLRPSRTNLNCVCFSGGIFLVIRLR